MTPEEVQKALIDFSANRPLKPSDLYLTGTGEDEPKGIITLLKTPNDMYTKQQVKALVDAVNSLLSEREELYQRNEEITIEQIDKIVDGVYREKWDNLENAVSVFNTQDGKEQSDFTV